MILPDINVLLYAFREDMKDHASYRNWLMNATQGDQAFGLSELVLSGFLRIATHPKIFNPPTPLSSAVPFVEVLRAQPQCVLISPGPSHWDIFTKLCEKTEARGGHITDAYFAALAIESGSEWITTDRDYSRYPGLKWRHPLENPH